MAKEPRITPQSTPTTATMLPPEASVPTPSRKRGKTPLTPEQKSARQAELAAEPKDRKFRRLANHRMPRALKAILSIAHLANRSQYEWTPEQAAKLCDALAKAVKTVADKFSGNKDNGTVFSL